MTTHENEAVVLEIFQALEARDREPLLARYHPDIEFHWPPSLPYGGSGGLEALRARAPDQTWSGTWWPLQPTETERRMDPRVVAAQADEVVVLWHQRGVHPTGQRLDMPVLGLYRVCDGKLARAQMFYFDTIVVADFLARGKGRPGDHPPAR